MSKYTDKALEVRARKDIHYNCAQGVLAAFAEDLGVDEDTAFRVGANFGRGMRMGGTCGAVTGALMALGLAGIRDASVSQELYRRVKENHEGCLDCRDLLRINAGTGVPQGEHCDQMVCELTALTEEILREHGILPS